MAKLNIPRLVIAGTSSGVGKTTIVTGLLAELNRRGLRVQSYKVGPDYIDPGYHALASGKPAHNLDTWLIPQEEIGSLFARTAEGNDIAIIEGVMGLYDGGRNGISSTAEIAKRLGAPVILVVDAKAAGESVAATVLGFKNYDPDLNIAGVIVNRLGSDTHKTIVVQALARLNIPVFGCIHRDETLMIKERHLGLTPVEETDALAAVAAMGDQIARQVAVDKLIEIAGEGAPIKLDSTDYVFQPTVSIGVANDEGFSFYYPESLDALRRCGALLVPFSPLKDNSLPLVDGLLLGGGFPEMFLRELSANSPMHQAIRSAAGQGMPIYAECGGLMYLTREIVAFNGEAYPMVGLVPAVCTMQPRLQTVGYVEAMALTDNVLCRAGERLRGHEFHFSKMEYSEKELSWAFNFTKIRTGEIYPGGFSRGNILASYLHIHFGGNRQAAEQFIAKCRQFRAKRGVG
jgi:cobyrinic acid a,c-diamide synthase